MVANYNIDNQRFEDAFELIKYRIGQENPGFSDAGHYVQCSLIVAGLEVYF